MQRLAFGVEYEGTDYSGWQSQQHQPSTASIQGRLESALTTVANHPVKIIGAGRTDAGVHACGQVLHCDVTASRSSHTWIHGVNANLPRDIRVSWVANVAHNFDARRSALGRQYKYVIFNDPIRPSLLSDYVAWQYTPLDAELMHAAAQFWLGEQDFTSFRGAGCQSKSPYRNLKSIAVVRRGQLIFIDIIADAFLYHMVRNMVGVLLAIGAGRRSITWAKEVLLAQDRTKAGITAPAQGLYLYKVIYSKTWQVPEHSASAWLFERDMHYELA